MAGNISATRLYQAALILEKNIMEERDLLGEAFTEFKLALSQIIKTITDLKLEKVTAALSESQLVATTFNQARIIPLLEKLAADLNGMRFDAHETFQELNALMDNAADEIKAQLMQLEEKIDKIEFQAAYELLNELKVSLHIK